MCLLHSYILYIDMIMTTWYTINWNTRSGMNELYNNAHEIAIDYRYLSIACTVVN